MRISVTQADESVVAPQTATVSRRPAAMAGIMLVVGLGLSFYGSSTMFTGQSVPLEKETAQHSSIANEVRITNDSFEPSTITVAPGDTITWNNNSDIPHILTSDTLETIDGLMATSPIFTGSTLSITIKHNAKPGTYTYISQTSALSGAIVVVEATHTPSSKTAMAVMTSSSSSSVSSEASSLSSAAVIPSSQSALGEQNAPSPFGAQVIGTQPPMGMGAVPRNPYTAGVVQQTPPTKTPSSVRSTPSSATSLHKGAPLDELPVTTHKPIRQPGSGPAESGVLFVLSVMLVTFICRKSLMQGAWTR